MKQIAEEGIRLECGVEKQDISHGKGGFYLTLDLSYTLDWAQHKGTADNAAVVVFKVSQESMGSFSDLNLYSDESAWKQVVTYSHRGRQH